MTYQNPPDNHGRRFFVWLKPDTICSAGILRATAAAMLVALSLVLPRIAWADAGIVPPPVPGDIQVPAGATAFLMGEASGTQNYVCLPSGAGHAWVLYGPDATLFDGNVQVFTHFLSPNPAENGVPRATWQHSKDSSRAWAMAVAMSTDSNYVAPGAIAWLKLQVVGAQSGPTAGNKLTPATWIHRVNTAGGVAPATGCAQPSDVGKKVLVPYTADYIFYKN